MLRPFVVAPNHVEDAEDPEDGHEEDDGQRDQLLGDQDAHLQPPLQPWWVLNCELWEKNRLSLYSCKDLLVDIKLGIVIDLALLGQFWRVMVFFCKLQHSYKDEIWTFIVLIA